MNDTVIGSSDLYLERAVGGLIVFATLCMSCLCALMVILFQPCKGKQLCCGKNGCGFCTIFCQFIVLKIYQFCCCRCCRKGQRMMLKKVGSLQEQMEKELESGWEEIDELE